MKAILVIDMPKHCSKCPYWDRDYPVCCVLNKENKSKDYGHRPKWCPLKSMPEKLDWKVGYLRDKNTYEIFNKNYVDGYNKCIDEILGEEK